MASDILQNVRKRITQSYEILKHHVWSKEEWPKNDWLLEELCGFNARLSFDVIVTLNGVPQSFKGVRVQHRNPQTSWIFKGGIRYNKNVTLSGMESHAIEMSIKSWLKDLPYGGAKGGIAIDPLEFNADDLKRITERFVDKLIEFRAIGSKKDVPAPDVGTDDLVMSWIKEYYTKRVISSDLVDQNPGAVVTGKPFNRKPQESGCPGRREATGLGMLFALDEYRKRGIIRLPEQPRVVIQGFGNVGMHFAYFLHKFKYASIVAVVDRFGGVYNSRGLNIPELIQYAQSNPQKTVAGFQGGDSIANDEFISLPCDIIAPCALEEVFTEKNAHKVTASVIIEGANGPTTPEADSIFKDKGITVLPDIDVNGGGVVVSFFEHERNINSADPRVPRGDMDNVIKSLEIFMRRSVGEITGMQEKLKNCQLTPRIAAYVRAIDKMMPLFKMKRLADTRKEITILEKDIENHPWPKQ